MMNIKNAGEIRIYNMNGRLVISDNTAGLSSKTLEVSNFQQEFILFHS